LPSDEILPSFARLPGRGVRAYVCIAKLGGRALVRIAAPKPVTGHKRSAILAAIFSAASALKPEVCKLMFTMTSPLRMMSAEPPGAR